MIQGPLGPIIMLVRNSALLLEKIDQLNWLNQLKYFIDFIHLIDLIVALRTPAMPFGLEAFVAVKLRSLCWQEIRRKCDQVPGERQSAAGSGKQEGR